MILYRILAARVRLVLAAAVAVAVLASLPGELRFATRLLLAWDCGVVVFLAAVAGMMAHSDKRRIQERADREDEGALATLVLTLLAAMASLAAIGAELHGLKGEGEVTGPGRAALAGLTILLSWLFVHTIFALHYAHDYFAGTDDREGLRFPTKDAPDYWDFLYFSFNLGAASQTSDVIIEAKRMRRLVLAHTILSFLFNTTVLALAINVGASLL
jgi:uncharacterized membrane protein